jgi:hypothetical protein
LKQPIAMAATLTSIRVTAQEKEFSVRVVSKGQKEIKVKTKEASGWREKTLSVDSKTKGIENVKAGAKVRIKYIENNGQLKAIEINPR